MRSHATAPERTAARSPLARTGGGQHAAMRATQQAVGNRALARAVELRPPGRGEASAFERREELLARINTQTPGVLYTLTGRVLGYEVLDPAAVVSFDTKMMQFIDQDAVIPLRLITNEGLVGGQRLLIDSLQEAYVDLDDMLACDDLSFQMNLIHFIEERSRIRNYEHRIGTNMDAEFEAAHRAGITAETAHLRSVIGDPSIEFTFEEDQGHGRVVFGFRSRAEKYRIFHVFTRGARGVQGGRVSVLTRDRRTLTIDELIAERGAAVPVP